VRALQTSYSNVWLLLLLLWCGCYLHLRLSSSSLGLWTLLCTPLALPPGRNTCFIGLCDSQQVCIEQGPCCGLWWSSSSSSNRQFRCVSD
jgi:hypothetical protein